MIIMYTKPNCPKCEALKEKLNSMNIDYKKVNITEDEEAYNFLIAKGHKSVPQLYDEKGTLIDVNRLSYTEL